jgi:DNA-binding transcriptional ArsR family regulator
MSGLNGDLHQLIEDAKRMHFLAVERMESARAVYENSKEEVQKIERILKAAGVEEEKPAPKPKKEKPVRVNEETRAKVLAAIKEIGYEDMAIPGVRASFTASMLAERTPDLHQSSVRTAINNLRDEGIIRAVGLVPNSPRKAPMAYTLGAGNEASE